jgi:hypothetical protein
MQYPTTEVLIAFFIYIYEFAGKSSNLISSQIHALLKESKAL